MPISDILAQISGEAPSSTDAVRPAKPSLPKRKADAELSRSNGKHAKTEQHAANTSRQVNTLAKASKINMEAPVRSDPKVGSRGAIQATTSRPEVAKGPPKKGSHAETMAKAAAAQQAFAQMGKIQHKPIEKGIPSRAAASFKRPGIGTDAKPGRSAGGSSWAKGSKPVQGEEGKEKAGLPIKGGITPKGVKSNGSKAARLGLDAPVKRVKKAATATTGYTGTARPNLAVTKPNPRGSSRPAPRLDRLPPARGPKPSVKPGRRYSYADEEDEEDEEEEEEGYGSDVSSDMEAAAYEVDEEEERAARIARQEDIEEERRLKREAEEKKRRMAARGGR